MLAGSALLLTPDFIKSAHAQQRALTGALDTRIGKIDLVMGLPANAQVEQKIYDEMDFERASQAYIWGIPIVGMNEWKLAHEKGVWRKAGPARAVQHL